MGSDKAEMKEGERKPTFSDSIGEEEEMGARARVQNPPHICYLLNATGIHPVPTNQTK